MIFDDGRLGLGVNVGVVVQREVDNLEVVLEGRIVDDLGLEVAVRAARIGAGVEAAALG